MTKVRIVVENPFDYACDVHAIDLIVIDSKAILEIDSADLFCVLKASSNYIRKLPLITTRDTVLIEISDIVLINNPDCLVITDAKQFNIEDIFKA